MEQISIGAMLKDTSRLVRSMLGEVKKIYEPFDKPALRAFRDQLMTTINQVVDDFLEANEVIVIEDEEGEIKEEIKVESVSFDPAIDNDDAIGMSQEDDAMNRTALEDLEITEPTSQENINLIEEAQIDRVSSSQHSCVDTGVEVFDNVDFSTIEYQYQIDEGNEIDEIPIEDEQLVVDSLKDAACIPKTAAHAYELRTPKRPKFEWPDFDYNYESDFEGFEDESSKPTFTIDIISECEADIKVNVKHLDAFLAEDKSCSSPSFVIKNVNWKVHVKVNLVKAEMKFYKYLGLYLVPSDNYSFTKFDIKADLTMNVISLKSSVGNITKTLSCVFRRKEYFGSHRMFSLKQLQDSLLRDYVKNDTVQLSLCVKNLKLSSKIPPSGW